jgi:hypothetical protein
MNEKNKHVIYAIFLLLILNRKRRRRRWQQHRQITKKKLNWACVSFICYYLFKMLSKHFFLFFAFYLYKNIYKILFIIYLFIFHTFFNVVCLWNWKRLVKMNRPKGAREEKNEMWKTLWKHFVREHKKHVLLFETNDNWSHQEHFFYIAIKTHSP